MRKLDWFFSGFTVLVLAAAGVCLASAQDKTSGPWVMQSSGTTAKLRGIHAVGGGVAWASGSDGTVLRTEDSGYMWQRCAMPPGGAEKLDFRGIWAWDENTAIVMSSGPGDLSRIYKTTDGCSHWKLLFTNPDKDGFWDAMVFWRGRECQCVPGGEEGVLIGDPVGGVFQRFDLRRRGDEIARSQYLSETPAPTGAEVFAASDSSIAVGKRLHQARHPILWFGTGGKPGPFVYRLDGNYAEVSAYYPQLSVHKWVRVRIPLAGGNDSSGIFSVAFRDLNFGVVVGGDYKKSNESSGTAASTADGGEHWTAATKPPHGYRSAVAWDADAKAWIAAGTNGSDISYDDGRTWAPLDNGNWNALSLPWVVGPDGRIAKLDAAKLPKK